MDRRIARASRSRPPSSECCSTTSMGPVGSSRSGGSPSSVGSARSSCSSGRSRTRSPRSSTGRATSGRPMPRARATAVASGRSRPPKACWRSRSRRSRTRSSGSSARSSPTPARSSGRDRSRRSSSARYVRGLDPRHRVARGRGWPGPHQQDRGVRGLPGAARPVPGVSGEEPRLGRAPQPHARRDLSPDAARRPQGGRPRRLGLHDRWRASPPRRLSLPARAPRGLARARTRPSRPGPPQPAPRRLRRRTGARPGDQRALPRR